MPSPLTNLTVFNTEVDTRRRALFSNTPSEEIDIGGHIVKWVSGQRLILSNDGEPSESTTQMSALFGSYLAAAIHLELHSIFDQAEAESEVVADELIAAEQLYEELLALSRAAALNKEAPFVTYLLYRLSDQLLNRLKDMLSSAGSRVTAENHLNRTRACHLARRTATLAAFLPQLYIRLSDSRLRGTTQGIAERREQIIADGPNSNSYVTSLVGLEPGERVVFVGELESAELVDRPNKPYSRLIVGDNQELRVHFKNSRWVGVGEKQSVWVRCKAEPPVGETSFAVAEFEGPTTTEGEIWESWMQQLVRDRYDLTPQSIHWFCSFPPLSSTLAPLDFSARFMKGKDNE